jgi:hypothetical protein
LADILGKLALQVSQIAIGTIRMLTTRKLTGLFDHVNGHFVYLEKIEAFE